MMNLSDMSRPSNSLMSVFSNRMQDSPGERAAYAGAILALLGQRDPLAVLRETPAWLASAIDDLSPTQVKAPESPGKWSIGQVLQHLADSDLVWGWRLRLILSHDRPQITGYDQDLWAERLHYADADPGQAVALFGGLAPPTCVCSNVRRRRTWHASASIPSGARRASATCADSTPATTCCT